MEQPLFRGLLLFFNYDFSFYYKYNMQILCNFAESEILRRWAALIL